MTSTANRKYLISIYVLLAPINWVPFITVSNLVLFKSLIFILLFISSVNVLKLEFPSVFTSFVGLLFILLTASLGMVSASSSLFENLKDIILPFLTIWIFYNVKLNESQLLDAFLIGIAGIAIICMLSIISHVTGVFNFTSPAPWFDDFGHGALGGYRTGWANSLFLFVPFLLYYLNVGRNFSFPIVVGLVAICGSQYISGGRAGFFASLASIILFSLRNSKSLIVVSLLAYLVITFIPEEAFIQQFRAENINSQYFNQEDVNRISSGRYEGYKVGLDLFLDRPLYGYGFGMSDDLSDLKGYMPEIHNTWLKRLIDGGLVFTVPLFLLFFHCFFKIRSKIIKLKLEDRKRYKATYIFFISLFFPALIITMVEPNYLFGSFQGEAFFWIMIGYLLRTGSTVITVNANLSTENRMTLV